MSTDFDLVDAASPFAELMCESLDAAGIVAEVSSRHDTDDASA